MTGGGGGFDMGNGRGLGEKQRTRSFSVSPDIEKHQFSESASEFGSKTRQESRGAFSVGSESPLVQLQGRGYHAAVNFGQYAYAGYFPNRPTISRTNVPTEDPDDKVWEMFMKKPEAALLRCFPSQIQATTVMTVLDILSNHSPDEEYIGETMEDAWAEDEVRRAEFGRFKGRLIMFDQTIDERNANFELKNRNGAGVVRYELLKPFSEPGVTSKGVPYSISI